jgi:hypothetical protein
MSRLWKPRDTASSPLWASLGLSGISVNGGDEWIDVEPRELTALELEEDRPRRPLSAVEYLVRFGLQDTGEEAQKFENIPLVDVPVMDCKSRLYELHLFQRS